MHCAQETGARRIRGKNKLNSAVLGSQSTAETLGLDIENRLLDTMALGQGNHWRRAAADDKHVLLTGGEFCTRGVDDTDDSVGTRVLLLQLHDADATNVMASRDHTNVSNVKLDELLDLTSFNVHADSVVDFDVRVGVADCARVVGSDVRNTLRAGLLALDLTQLVRALLLSDEVQHEAALDIIQKSEGFLGALDGNDVHEASGERGVSAHLPVDLHEALHQDGVRLCAGERILQAIAQDERERQALAQLCRAGGWARCPDATQLAEHPVRRRIQALQVLLRTASHGCSCGGSRR
jgi:hypothetical protein